MSASVVSMFSFAFSAQTLGEVVETVFQWIDEETRCRYIVPVNVDVLIKQLDDPDLQAALRGADLVLPDGQPVVWGSHLLGPGLPERVCGSDLVPAIFEAARLRPVRVFLLGAAAGVATEAARQIERKWAGVAVVGTYSPPYGFERDLEECDRILGLLAAAKPDVVAVGFGAPKQEVWVQRHLERIDARVVICCGATIDFLARVKRRAPKWVQDIHLEWTWRLLSEPRRLAGRYVKGAILFPWMLGLEAMRARRRP